uniref:O-methyltransferase C-terminal domain-containing protein n=1 Tax=Physcomitrium patens TaxID=3218 RepID=A0A2K1IQ99_PHYPA|nr:hypothetical protein PHYPA_025577 [Physcomitrium patens]
MPGKVIDSSYLGGMLRLASSVKVLREVATMSEDGSTELRYGLEPIGKFLVGDAEKGSLVHLLLMYQVPVLLSTWNHLPESVVDDSVQPFAIFNKAMAGHSKLYMRAFLDVYEGFEGVRVLIDIGGGFGSAITTITCETTGLLSGVEHTSGDMFESIPTGGDAISLKIRKLGLDAGFMRVDVVCKVDQLSVTEFVKAWLGSGDRSPMFACDWRFLSIPKVSIPLSSTSTGFKARNHYILHLNKAGIA